jgi:hypothetical protein
MEVCGPEDIHGERTRPPHRYSYCFTPKHHGWGLKSDGQWLPDLPRAEEFAVFDMADFHQLTDPGGNLYGLRIQQVGEQRELLELGTAHQQIARFWAEEQERPWHGHPLWPIQARDSPNRARQKYCPPREVFDRMVALSVLTRKEAARLSIGKHVGKLKSPGSASQES